MIKFHTARHWLARGLTQPLWLVPLILAGLSACGGSSGSTILDDPTEDLVNPPRDPLTDDPEPGDDLNEGNRGGISGAQWPELNLSADNPKELTFSWTAVDGADHYRLFKDPDGASGFSQVGEPVTQTRSSDTIAVHNHDWLEARYLVEACFDPDCTDSEDSQQVVTQSAMLDSLGYFKASNTDASDWFGWDVSLSADGRTLAVSALREASQTGGVNGDETDNSVFGAGAVYVFSLENGNWQQQAYLKASNAEQPGTDEDGNEVIVTNDRFGYQLVLSDDGDTLAVSALLEDSNGRGVNGEEDNNESEDAGAVYVFNRTDGSWNQSAFLKAFNTEPEGDGESGEEDQTDDGSDTGETDDTLLDTSGDLFGYSLALSGDGRTLAVGARLEDSNAEGINGDADNNARPDSGAVYVFSLDDTDTWQGQAFVKASNSRQSIVFGSSLALSTDGNAMAVGAPGEGRDSRGVNANQNPNRNPLPGTGAVYTFIRNQGEWQQEAYIKPETTYRSNALRFNNVFMEFGQSLTLSGNGQVLAVGARGDLSRATGVDGDPEDYEVGVEGGLNLRSGAVWVYRKTDNSWAQESYLKASNSQTSIEFVGGIEFGHALSLSEDGNQLVATAWREHGGNTGVGGDELDTTSTLSGAAYVFEFTDNNWRQTAYLKSTNTERFDNFGVSAALSADGQTLAIGAHREDGAGTGLGGDTSDNTAEDSGAAYLF